MKTIALMLITLFGFNLSSFSNTNNGSDTAGNCCPLNETTSQNQWMLDQLQRESENIPVDNVTGLTSVHLTKAVNSKMHETVMADRIQQESEEIYSHLPVVFWYKESSAVSHDNQDSSMLEKLQKETESISITKPIFFLADKLNTLARGKSAHSKTGKSK